MSATVRILIIGLHLLNLWTKVSCISCFFEQTVYIKTVNRIWPFSNTQQKSTWSTCCEYSWSCQVHFVGNLPSSLLSLADFLTQVQIYHYGKNFSKKWLTGLTSLWIFISVKPISDIGEWILAAVQYQWIQYTSLHVSADTDMPAVAVTINNNRTWQASETHGHVDRNEARISIQVPL